MRQTRNRQLIPLTPPGNRPLAFCHFPLCSPGTYLGVEVSAHGLLSPRLEVELSSALFFWVAHHIGHGLREKAGSRERIDLFPFFMPVQIELYSLKRCQNPNPPVPVNLTLFRNRVSADIKLR